MPSEKARIQSKRWQHREVVEGGLLRLSQLSKTGRTFCPTCKWARHKIVNLLNLIISGDLKYFLLYFRGGSEILTVLFAGIFIFHYQYRCVVAHQNVVPGAALDVVEFARFHYLRGNFGDLRSIAAHV